MECDEVRLGWSTYRGVSLAAAAPGVTGASDLSAGRGEGGGEVGVGVDVDGCMSDLVDVWLACGACPD